jgi:hypothetical protein
VSNISRPDSRTRYILEFQPSPIRPVTNMARGIPPPAPTVLHSQPASSDGPCFINCDVTDKIVDGAVQEALGSKHWPTAYSIRTLYDDHRTKTKFVSLMDALSRGCLTEKDNITFRTMVKYKKKEARRLARGISRDSLSASWTSLRGRSTAGRPRISKLSKHRIKQEKLHRALRDQVNYLQWWCKQGCTVREAPSRPLEQNILDEDSISDEKCNDADIAQNGPSKNYASLGRLSHVGFANISRAFDQMPGQHWKSSRIHTSIHYTISRDNTQGESARRAALLAEFGKSLSRESKLCGLPRTLGQEDVLAGRLTVADNKIRQGDGAKDQNPEKSSDVSISGVSSREGKASLPPEVVTAFAALCTIGTNGMS